MALNQTQKTKILFYTGWSGLTIVPDTTHYSKIIADRLQAASDVEEICKIVRGILEKLEEFDACLEKAKCRLAASKVDNITTNKDEIAMILKERKRCIREMADLLAIPISKSGGVMIGVCN